MPKGRKRTPEEYNKEIEEAAKRMKKRPEHLKAAKNSKDWFNFLGNIGIDVDTTARRDFFNKVQNEIRPRRIIPVPLTREYKPISFDRALIKEAHYVRKSGTTQTVYHSAETGRFISRADAESRLKNV